MKEKSFFYPQKKSTFMLLRCTELEKQKVRERETENRADYQIKKNEDFPLLTCTQKLEI